MEFFLIHVVFYLWSTSSMNIFNLTQKLQNFIFYFFCNYQFKKMTQVQICSYFRNVLVPPKETSMQNFMDEGQS